MGADADIAIKLDARLAGHGLFLRLDEDA